MGLYKHSASPLLSLSEAQSEGFVGDIKTLATRPGDTVNDTQQGFKAIINLAQTGGDTTPTSKVIIESSPDNSDWFVAAESEELTSDGSMTEVVDLDILAAYVRAKTVLTGGTLPSHTAKVQIISNGSLTLTAV